MLRGIRYSAIVLLAWCAACTTPTQKPDEFEAPGVDYKNMAGWQQDNHVQALDAFLQSCKSLSAHAQDVTEGSHLQISPKVWQSLCADGMSVRGNETQARLFFERRFAPYRITNRGETEGLFTGYYEPMLHGSRHKDARYKYPLYLPPPELKDNKPYLTRAEIDRGALNGRHLELLWVDDPVMLFFLHVQGSGHIVFPDGKQIRVGFADKNGQPYTSLGKVAGDEGLLPKGKIDLFTLRQWLYNHPDRAMSVMEKNASYVFFKEIPGPGPTGTLNIVLTPGRSLAVDSHFVPLGLPMFLSTQLPTEPNHPSVAIHRLMMAQDTGTAIHGAIRGDVFFGAGKNAEYQAGMMKALGSVILLVPREVTYQLR